MAMVMFMVANRHAQPVYVLAREPRPSDRETRMCTPSGKWGIRAVDAKPGRMAAKPNWY